MLFVLLWTRKPAIQGSSKYGIRPIFAIRFVILGAMAFQPMPLSRKLLPFDHSEWTSGFSN
jgi:hypothetical protein